KFLFITFTFYILFSSSIWGSVTLKYDNSFANIETFSSNPNILLPLNEIADHCGIDFLWNAPNEQMTLSKDGRNVRLMIDNQYALINGIELAPLSVSPSIFNGAFVLQPSDTVLVLSKILPFRTVSYDEQTLTIYVVSGEKPENQQNAFTNDQFITSNSVFYEESDLPGNFNLKTVVIDPGHGGHDAGATRNRVYEKDIVLDVSKKLAELLKSRTKLNVIMTRSTDVFIPLSQRTSIANRYPADSTLFICIHCNASRSKVGGRGTETYVFDLEATDAEARALASRENEGESMDLTMILSHCYHTGTEPYSLDIAKRVQKSLTTKLSFDNRGVRRAPFYVLAGTKMPAILVELAYISNTEEREKLQSENFRQKAAEALYDAIIGFQDAVNKSLAKLKPN
ncbi:MAG: N-acetylmuramoyl-L-alanine amidase, partial [Candidatus Poribacteria bacterium]